MITAAAVKELRDRTGAGMMDCKRALQEVQGDLEKAIALLREKGLAAAAKRAGRAANQGLIMGQVKGSEASLIEVNCETDFVAKNEDFQEWVQQLADTVLENKFTSVEQLLEHKIDGLTVQEELTNQIATIGENMGIRRVAYYQPAENTLMDLYIHGGGRIGVLVALKFANEKAIKSELAEELAHDLALQIAASRPLYIDSEEVPADIVEKEKEIYLAQAINEGKPENIAQRMVEGRIRKYFEEICLVEQVFVKDTGVSVGQLLKNVAKELNTEIAVKSFTRFEIGEGFEAEESEN
ncbi:MAG: elongation factor Ts [Firmicutes bacterium]|nr:elongation factor Ts [Bacillota bacterium]